jgi:eukaryotic-like serine/threonine-protein kinase
MVPLLTPAQFAEVKALYLQVCDLPEVLRQQQLAATQCDPSIVAQVRKMLAMRNATGRLAQPVLNALKLDLPPTLGAGDVLGAWTLEQEIGHGGMGRVFKAKRSDGHFEQVAAVKLLAGTASAAALKHLARERQILASLVHPNIARLLDGASTPAGQPYLVMEYVQGLTIDVYCQEKKLSQAAILRLYADVCAAVAFAHQNLIIHCDLKPNNVLVTNDGRPILLDFGISRLLMDSTPLGEISNSDTRALGLSNVTNLAYTPGYASPEQQTLGRVSTTTDVYSLAVMLSELLGVALFKAPKLDTEFASQPTEIITKQTDSSAATNWHVAALNLTQLSPDLAAIIQRATRILPAERYASVSAFATDLLRYTQRLPVAARKPSWGYVLRLWLHRHWPLAVAGGLFLTLILAFSWRMRTERNRALQSEQTALAVKDFMVSVFQSADPEISGQRDLPISTLLDAGRARLTSSLASQPRVRAELSGILGSVYQNIGQRDKALKLLEEAIAIERAQSKNLHTQSLSDLLHKQAYTLYDMEEFPRAEPIAREALARNQQFAPGTVALMESQRLLGTILLYQGKFKASKKHLQDALALADKVSGLNSVATARLDLDFARYYAYSEPQPRQGIPFARRATANVEREKGRDSALYADAIEILALVLGNSGELTEAIPLALESSEKRAKLYGEVSYQAEYSLYTYASLLNQAGANNAALPILERCVRIQEQLDGKGTLSSEVPIFKLANVHEAAGNLSQALAFFQAAIEIRMRLLPAQNRNLQELHFFMGRILRLQGKLSEAEFLTLDVLKQRRANPDTHPVHVMRSQLETAALLRTQRRFQAATAMLAAIDRASFGDASWQQGYLDAETGRIALAMGENALALTMLLKAEAQLTAGLGAQHPEVWLLRIDRAELLRAMGQKQAARALAAQIADKAKASFAPGSYWDQRLAALRK